MKSFFKISAISMVVLGMTGSAYATMSNQNTANNTAWSPHLTGVFLGVDGLDLQPRNGDLDYVTVFPGSSGGSIFVQNISPSYNWNWRVYGGIKFIENDDITLSWMQMRTSENSSVSPAIQGVPSFSVPRWFISDDWQSVSSHVTFDLDDYYGVFGHTVNFNNPWSVRFAGGIEYAKVDSNLTVQEREPFLSDNRIFGFTGDSDFKGTGPRVETDLTYHLPYNFALFADANAALLIGRRDISLNTLNDGTFNAFPSTNYSTRHVVVPKLGMRLGVSYSYIFGQVGGEGCRSTTLTVDAGWQGESYIHAIERPDNNIGESVDAIMLSAPAHTVFATTKTSNFSDQGWFVGVKVGMDWL